MPTILNTGSQLDTANDTLRLLSFNANFAGPSKKLCVSVTSRTFNGNGAPPDNVTFNGVNCTLAVDTFSTGGFPGGLSVAIWYMDNPPAVTANILVSFPTLQDNTATYVYLVDDLRVGAPLATDTSSEANSDSIVTNAVTGINSFSVSGASSDEAGLGGFSSVSGTGTTGHPGGVLETTTGADMSAFSASTLIESSTNPSITYNTDASASLLAVLAAWRVDSFVTGVSGGSAVGDVFSYVLSQDDVNIINTAVHTDDDNFSVINFDFFAAVTGLSDRKLVVISGFEDSSTTALTSSVTFNGSGLTEVVGSSGDSGGFRANSSIWYIDNPDVVEGTISVSFSQIVGEGTVFAYLLNNVSAGTALLTDTDSGLTATNFSMSVAATGRGFAVSSLAAGQASVTYTVTGDNTGTLDQAPSGQTNPPNSSSYMTSFNFPGATPATVTHSYTGSVAANRTGAAMAYWRTATTVEIVSVTGVSSAGAVGTVAASAGVTQTVSTVSSVGAAGTVEALNITIVQVTGVASAAELGAVSIVADANNLVTGLVSGAVLGIQEVQVIGGSTLNSVVAPVVLGDIDILIQFSTVVTGLSSAVLSGTVDTVVNNRIFPAGVATAGAVGNVGTVTNAVLTPDGVATAVELDTALVWGPVAPAVDPNWTEIVP